MPQYSDRPNTTNSKHEHPTLVNYNHPLIRAYQIHQDLCNDAIIYQRHATHHSLSLKASSPHKMDSLKPSPNHLCRLHSSATFTSASRRRKLIDPHSKLPAHVGVTIEDVARLLGFFRGFEEYGGVSFAFSVGPLRDLAADNSAGHGEVVFEIFPLRVIRKVTDKYSTRLGEDGSE